MKAKKEKKQLAKDTLETQERTESTWMDNVRCHTENDLTDKTLPELKAVLSILLMYLSTAPSYECQEYLQTHIESVRRLIVLLSDSSISIVKPP